jgi:hypothetical protein
VQRSHSQEQPRKFKIKAIQTDPVPKEKDTVSKSDILQLEKIDLTQKRIYFKLFDKILEKDDEIKQLRRKLDKYQTPSAFPYSSQMPMLIEHQQTANNTF